MAFLLAALLFSGCATPRYYVFEPTVFSLEINAPEEKVYGQLQETIRKYPFRVLESSSDHHTIVATSHQSGFQKAGLVAGRFLTGVTYGDQILFAVSPREPGSELQVRILVLQRLHSLVEKIPVDPEHPLYKRASALAHEVKTQAESL